MTARINDKTEVAVQGSGGKSFQTLRPISPDALRGQQRACIRRLRKVCGIRESVGGGEVCEGNGLRRKIGESSRASLQMRCTPTSPLPFPLVLLLCPPWQHLKVTVTHTKPPQGTYPQVSLAGESTHGSQLTGQDSPHCDPQLLQHAGLRARDKRQASLSRSLYFTLRMRKGNKKATHSLLFGK